MEYLSNSKISIDHPDFQHMSYGGFLSKYAGNKIVAICTFLKEFEADPRIRYTWQFTAL